MVPPMRVIPLLTLSIAPCGVLGWYGTQKLMAEPIKTTEPDAPSVNTDDAQTVNTADESFIESQPMVDVKPWAAINQPKFSSLSKSSPLQNTATPSPGNAPASQPAIQNQKSLLVTTPYSAPITINRNQIRQAVSRSTQSALQAVSLDQSTLPEPAVVAPEMTTAPTEEQAETIAAEAIEPTQVDQTVSEVATPVSEQSLIAVNRPEEATSQPQPSDTSLEGSVPVSEQSLIAVNRPEEATSQPQPSDTSSEGSVPVSEQPLMAVDRPEEVTVQPQPKQSSVNVTQSSDTVSVRPLEIEHIEQSEPYPETVQSNLDQSVFPNSDTLVPDLAEAKISEAETPEVEISAASISYSSFDADVALSNLNVSQEPLSLTAQQTSAPVLNPFINENYILGPGDVISVDVFGVPEYSGQHSISADGSITLPQLGRVLVHSMTMQQASDEIAALYAFTLESPLISVQVVQQRPVQVAISGEIIQAGLYTVSPQGTTLPRLFEALQQAGGVTQSADIKQIEVRRRTENGGQTILRADLFALLQNGDISQNLFLQDGDVILIPAATTVDMEVLTQLPDSNLGDNVNQPIDIAIVGEVNQPGPHRLGSEGGRITVVQALQQAGGITQSANLRDVQLRRQTRQGEDQFFDINLWDLLQTGDLSQDLVLQQGDTLVVPAADVPIPDLIAATESTLSTGSIAVNVLGEVENPGTQQISSSASLNQAILSAGGLNRRTRGKVTLVRFNPDGTVSQRPITVDLSQEINAETNPLLRPNDVILVGRSARAALEDTLRDFSGPFNLVLPLLLLGL